MRYIIRAVESRMATVNEILKQIPEAEVLVDTSGNAMKSFLAACTMAGDDAVVMLEDDITLTSDFKRKIETAISRTPNMLINFFSLSRKHTKTHMKPWRQFCMNQCVYMPKGFCKECVAKYEEWKEWDGDKNKTAYDFLMGYVWHKDYLVYCPSLVQHNHGQSLINPKRNPKRQSITFEP